MLLSQAWRVVVEEGVIGSSHREVRLEVRQLQGGGRHLGAHGSQDRRVEHGLHLQ